MKTYIRSNRKLFVIIFLICVFVLCPRVNLCAEDLTEPDIDTSTLESLPDAASAKRHKTDVVYLPILMYHQISESQSRLGSYVISDDEFENDLQLLKRNGYTTITVADLLKYVRGKAKLPVKPIMLTFDDGFESDYVYAFPLLQKYQMKAIFSIIGKYTDLYSQDDVHKHINYAHLSWEEIREMHESGLADFHSHTYDMHVLESRRGALRKKGESMEAYEKAMTEDLGRLNQAYKDHIGLVPAAFTCPFGCFNDTLADILKKEGFQTIFTSYQKINKLTGDPDELFHLNRFVRSHNRDIEKLVASWNELYETQNQKRSS